MLGLDPSLRNFSNCSRKISYSFVKIQAPIGSIPVSPFSATLKRIKSECEDDDGDNMVVDDLEFRSLLFVVNVGISATFVEEVKRFSATKILRIQFKNNKN